MVLPLTLQRPGRSGGRKGEPRLGQEPSLAGGRSDKDTKRAFVRSMPVSYVLALLKTEQLDRDSRSNGLSNDIFDMDATSLAVPYCRTR